MSLCNLVSRITFKALSWKQRESKLLFHLLYENDLPAYAYPHKTIQTQSSPVLSQPQPRKKPHELHSINYRNNYNMSHHFCRKLSQQVPHPGRKWPLTNPCGFICGLCRWDHSWWEQLRLRGCSRLGELCCGAWCLQGMGSAVCVLCTLRDWLLKQLLASSCRMSKVSLQTVQKLTWKILTTKILSKFNLTFIFKKQLY